MMPMSEDPSPEGGSRERTDQSSVAVVRKSSSGPAAPIVDLAKLAFKDAVLELETKVRSASNVSSGAALQVWQSAEKRLGLEVTIEDPAMRALFDLHVVAVEELCQRVRSHAKATSAAVEAWSSPPLWGLAAELRLLSPQGDESAKALGSELGDADQATAAARQRLMARIQTEVNTVIDVRIYRHNDVRAAVRERHLRGGVAAAARRDVARLRKASSGESGLLSLGGQSSVSPLEQAEERLQGATLAIAKLDEQVLTSLFELGSASVDAVRRPWAALLQIQAEFYTAQQSIWTPLSQSFDEFSAEAGGQAQKGSA